MNRSNCLVSFVLFSTALWAAPLRAATVSSTHVYTDPVSAYFFVDGQLFNGSSTFQWPAGSKHTLNIADQQLPFLKTRYSFNGWTDSTGLLQVSTANVVITADPGITYYKAAIIVQHAVSLNFFTCPNPNPATCDSPGTVFVNNAPYLVDTDVYFDAGSTIVLRAVPNPGFVFVGWLQGLGNSIQAYLNSFMLKAPVSVYPQFINAAMVTLTSNPPGLQLFADNTQIAAPVTIDWGLGTTHTLAAVSPQTDLHGKLWVFNSWSDAGDPAHAYTMPSQTSGLTLTVNYVAGGRASFLSNPTGLKLAVDGRNDWPGYNFVWAAGATHTVSAPAQQTDLNGRGWSFNSWSNGGPATQTIVLSNADIAAGYRLTATYDTLSRTVIQSSPSGLQLQAGGAACVTPCVLQRPIGSSIPLS